MADRKIILFGAGLVGQKAFNFYGGDKIYCFADNIKAGQELRGKRIISFEELTKIHADYRVIISASITIGPILSEQCAAVGINAQVWSELVSFQDFKAVPEIARFKDKHKGERCFLIGNGPSLRMEDLDKLHAFGEISFGCNFITKIFDKTEWRPKYYFLADIGVMNLHYEMLADIEAEVLFLSRFEDVFIGDISAVRAALAPVKRQIIYYNQLSFNNCNETMLPFSDDPSLAVHPGATVMYAMLQFAAYMGFDRIYLLGVDNTPVSIDNTSGRIEMCHFYDEKTGASDETFKVTTYLSPETNYLFAQRGYHTAEKTSREHGFRVFNATRGGALEVFERVDFDSLF